MNIRCSVTRYSLIENVLRESTSVEETSYVIEQHGGEDYILLGNCAGSAPVNRLIEDAKADRDWCADAGSAPVYVAPCSHGPRPCAADCGCGPADDVGGWGGRNYPRVVVEASELRRVLCA